MSVITRPGAPETDTAAHLAVNPARIALRLAANTRLWERVVRFDPAERWYTRIAAESHLGQPDWEAWLLSWMPGQGTPWHDHGGSAGAIVVLQGELAERTADTAADTGSPLVRPGEEVLGTGRLRTFGRRHLHRIDNTGDAPAVSLHVYAPGLAEMNDYAVDGDDRLVLTASRRAGESW